ncbi:hypothetical protein KR222_001739, partial [Zaprionus bogoriensis]
AMLLLMLVLVLSVGAAVGYDDSVNYWEAFEPGRLLQRLDALTLRDGQQQEQHLAASSVAPAAQPKLDEDVYEEDTETETETETETDSETDADNDANVDTDTDIVEHVTADDDVQLAGQLESAETQSGEDYERSYEQFVRQYFDRVPDTADEYDDNAEPAEQQQLDASIEPELEQTEASSVQKPKQKRGGESCRRVRRKGQLCRICREPRNNEVSETCSYSHADEPEAYAYGSGSQYKRYRDKAPQADGSSSGSSSLCVRRMQGKSVCYDCKDSGGKRMTRCYDAALKKRSSSSTTSKSSGAKPRKPRSHASQKSEQEQEQRIYKRTISYSYAQGSSPTGLQDNQEEPTASNTTTTTTTTTTAAAVTPSPTGRKLAKVVRRRVALPPS